MAKLNDKNPSVRSQLTRAQLKQRVIRDQEARFALIELSKQDSDNQKEAIARVARIDQENTTWLKALVEQHGWPGKTLVGVEGAQRARLLAQHADENPEFQQHCLELMTKMPSGEVSGIDLAYLTDRVLAAKGEPQRYGTQCALEQGKAVVNNVEDRANLNKRRAEVGLGTIESYLKSVEAMYKV